MSLASKKAPEDITSGALFLAATIFFKIYKLLCGKVLPINFSVVYHTILERSF